MNNGDPPYTLFRHIYPSKVWSQAINPHHGFVAQFNKAAGSIYNKPTLNYLEDRFNEDERLKQAHKISVKTSVDWVLVRSPKSLQSFKNELEKNKMNLVVRQNNSGIVYGLTYVDHNTKCVFNGTFCPEIVNDHSAINREQSSYKDLPPFAKVETIDILKSYLQVKEDVAMIVQTEIERMLDTPELNGLIIKKA